MFPTTLFTFPSTLQVQEDGTTEPHRDLIGSIVGLYRAYRPGAWFTSSLEMFRKLILIVALTTLGRAGNRKLNKDDGTDLRLLFGAGIITILAAISFGTWTPYRLRAANRFQTFAQFCLCYLYFDGTALIDSSGKEAVLHNDVLRDSQHVCMLSYSREIIKYSPLVYVTE